MHSPLVFTPPAVRFGSGYRTCTRCVMDTSDPGISFAADGTCSHCRHWDALQSPHWKPDDRGAAEWGAAKERIRAAGRGRPYDAMIGLSGGVDSAYLALRLAGQGLRLLAVHVDAGWNSATAVGNIERLVRHLDVDLATFVVDWEEMRDLQLAFLRAAVPNQDIPQDHAFFARLNHEARTRGIRFFLSGHNLASESVLPSAWGYNAMDLRHLRAIHRRFGQRPLRRFPTIPLLRLRLIDPLLHGYQVLRPLDWMPYDREAAKRQLTDQLGWRDYGEKHHESRFTRFFQTCWLPAKFGYDKRRAHWSSLILSGQARREQALDDLSHPPFDPSAAEDDYIFLSRKLRIPIDDFIIILNTPPRQHEEFPSNAWITRLSARLRR